MLSSAGISIKGREDGKMDKTDIIKIMIAFVVILMCALIIGSIQAIGWATDIYNTTPLRKKLEVIAIMFILTSVVCTAAPYVVFHAACAVLKVEKIEKITDKGTVTKLCVKRNFSGDNPRPTSTSYLTTLKYDGLFYVVNSEEIYKSVGREGEKVDVGVARVCYESGDIAMRLLSINQIDCIGVQIDDENAESDKCS